MYDRHRGIMSPVLPSVRRLFSYMRLIPERVCRVTLAHGRLCVGCGLGRRRRRRDRLLAAAREDTSQQPAARVHVH